MNYEELDAKDPETLTEEEKVALLGRPRLGDITKIQIRIRESKEFKVRVHTKMTSYKFGICLTPLPLCHAPMLLARAYKIMSEQAMISLQRMADEKFFKDEYF